MKHLFLAVCLAAALPHAANAQSRAFDCLEGKKGSGAIKLSEVQARYQATNSIEADFEQDSYLASLDMSEASSGKMYFEKPGKMKWDYLSPEQQTFLLNKSTAYFFQPNEKQLVIDELSSILITDLPVAFIMGLGNLDKDFNMVSSCKAALGDVLTLKPKLQKADDGVSIKELKLLVKQGDHFPAGGRVTDTSGNVTAVVFQQTKINVSHKASLFDPDFPSGIDVHDKRKEK
jgi:outer membrane lipoprotein carrier protein